ncbi:MAG: Nif3-like dinuclear metal center hexameric protein [Paludibacteraceae bacterium]|nr:Nif3-like dinuclear metal center hexameric protein [Paludibacteraceae bacterium]
MLLREIIDSIESVAPRSAQEQWDNSGMQVGDTGRDIQSVLLTTDVTPEVVDEAVILGCQLIVSHHPLLFHGLKQVCGQTPQALVVAKAIKHDIAIYSAHTSLDSVPGGINTRLADRLGIRDYHMLVPAEGQKEIGLGIIGRLPEPMDYTEFITCVRDTLNCTYVRYTRSKKEQIQTVALCGGSGAEFIEEAIAQGADVYITADCKYHEFQDADGRIGLIDIDHWISERHAREIFRDILSPLGIQCIISKTDKTPIQVWQEQKN